MSVPEDALLDLLRLADEGTSRFAGRRSAFTPRQRVWLRETLADFAREFASDLTSDEFRDTPPDERAMTPEMDVWWLRRILDWVDAEGLA